MLITYLLFVLLQNIEAREVVTQVSEIHEQDDIRPKPEGGKSK